MSDKKRLDSAMHLLGCVESREKARAMIMSGCVYVNGQKADKPSQLVTQADLVEIRSHALPYVSRGGLKLEKALSVFPVLVKGVTAVDVGASTGGFTDCLLQNGAKHVFAVDVGYGQLDWRLRNDERVTVMERTNARFMQSDWFHEQPSFACMDVSFISIRLILPALRDSLAKDSTIIALIKPQFEAGKGKVGKKGVVRESAVHQDVIVEILAFVRDKGFVVCGLDFSPITGPEGNVEFLLCLKTQGTDAWDTAFDAQIAEKTVQAAKTAHERP